MDNTVLCRNDLIYFFNLTNGRRIAACRNTLSWVAHDELLDSLLTNPVVFTLMHCYISNKNLFFKITSRYAHNKHKYLYCKPYIFLNWAFKFILRISYFYF